MLELKLLGGFEARLPDGRLVAVSSRKACALLTFLALHPGKAILRERLAALFWSERIDRSGRNSLSQALTALRKSFSGAGLFPIEIRTDALSVPEHEIAVDALTFERLLASGSPQDLEVAEALYQGDLLAGVEIRDPAFEEWLGHARGRLRGLAIEGLTRLLDHRLEQKHHAALIRTAQNLLKLDEMSEPAHRALMRCYADQGLTSAAVRQYRECARVLREELGIDPSDETRRLYAAMTARVPVSEGATADGGRTVSGRSSGPPRGEPMSENKQVTVLCAEITGAGQLFETLPPAEAQAVIDDGLVRVQASVQVFGGTLLRTTETRVLAIFGAPAVQADHAVKACTAALDMHLSVQRLSRDLGARTDRRPGFRAAIDSGAVLIRGWPDGEAPMLQAVGLAVRLAGAMVESGTHAGTIVTARAQKLASDVVECAPLGQIALDGFDIPIETFALTGERPARTRFAARRDRGLAPFVGRRPEMEFLSNRLQGAAASQGQIVGIIGQPGAGKSRLIHEFTRGKAARGWRVLGGAAVAHRASQPWLPVAELLRSVLHIDPSDDAAAVSRKISGHFATCGGAGDIGPALRMLLGFGADEASWQRLEPQERRTRTIAAVRILLTVESEVRPLILAFEDLQWFDAESLALLDALIEGLAGHRLLVLASYRPEYAHGWNALSTFSQLRVDSLAETESRELLTALLGDDSSLQETKDALARRTQGNPLFIEECVSQLVESSGLVGRPGAYRQVGSLEGLGIPDTAQAIVAERIDRLALGPKRLLQLASVSGTAFTYPLIRAAAGLSEAELNAALAELQRSDFLAEVRVLPSREFSFKHAITQQVAYESQAQDHRAESHRRVGEALESALGARWLESADTLAAHFERAGDDPKAARYFTAAADRAREQYANASAVDFYSRALAAVERIAAAGGGPAQADIRHILESRGQLLSLLGDGAAAAADFHRLGELARSADDPLAEAIAMQRSAQLAVTDGAYDSGIRDALQALQIARQIDDRPLIARSLITLGDVHIHGIRGEDEVGVAYLEEALPLCREIGDEAGAAEALCHLGYIRLLKGDYPKSLELFNESLALARANDDRPRAAFDLIFLGIIAMDLADFAKAERLMSDGVAQARQIEAQVLAAIGQTFLAWLEVKRGGYSRAPSLLDEAARVFEAAGANSWIPLIHDIRGEWLLRQGDTEAARASFEAALPLAREVEDPCWQSFALNGLAHIHGLRGDEAEAERYHRESLRFCAMKSDIWVRCRAEALASWATVQLHLGNPGLALDLASRLLRYAEDYGMRQFAAEARNLEGKALHAGGRSEDASRPLDLAMRLSLEIGDSPLHRDAAAFKQQIGRSLD